MAVGDSVYGGPVSHWRDRARATIARVIAANPGADREAMARAIALAYPLSDRRRWPYKCWLVEQRAALAKLYPEPEPADRTGTLFQEHKR